MMYSKVVARQSEEAANIASAAIKNAEQVAAGLTRHFGANLGADPSQPDWKVALEILGQNLLESSHKLVMLDVEYQTQLRLENQLRERRDEGTEKLRNQLRGARFLLDQTFGRQKASSYFPDRADITRVAARNLLPIARAMSLLLRGSGVEWPLLDGEGHVPKPVELATSLDAAASELEAALEALRPERKGNVFLLGTKKAEYAATGKVVRGTTAALGGLFRVAGFDFAAERLRSRTRSRAKPAGEGSEGGEGPVQGPPAEVPTALPPTSVQEPPAIPAPAPSKS